MADVPNAVEKAREFVSFERLSDERFVLALVNFALFSDVVLGLVYGRNLLSITYTGGEQLPIGALAVALIVYGAVSAFAAPLLRKLLLRITAWVIPDPSRNGFVSTSDAMSWPDLERIGLLTDKSGLLARAAKVQRDWEEANRFRSQTLVFGALILVAQFAVRTSVLAATLRSVVGEWHMPLVLLSAVGGIAATVYGVAYPPFSTLHILLRTADQQLLEQSLPTPKQPTRTPVARRDV